MEKSDQARFEAIDRLLRIDERDAFWEAALTNYERDFSAWYSRLLSALTLMTTGDDLIYGQAALDSSGRAEVIVVTSSLMVTASVDPRDATTSPRVTAVSRKGIESLSVTASQGVDTKGSQAQGWPERLSIQAFYRGSAQAIDLRGNAYDSHLPDNVGAIWTLFKALRSDLAASESERLDVGKLDAGEIRR